MLGDIFNTDRRLRIDHKKLLASPFVNNELIDKIDRYLSDFAVYNNLTPKDILQSYNAFAERYSADIKDFISTGKYPNDLGKKDNINRIDYDISLILSPVITIHRHRIMDNLIRYSSKINGKVLIIGLGSGIELELLALYSHNVVIEAYDICITEFVKKRFKQMKINEQEFSGRQGVYDHIFSIELLEHLTDPYAFALMCYDSLNREGNFIVTTATSMPQFDHLYNFTNDLEFENEICKLGFAIVEKQNILHDHLFQNIDSRNTWYVLRRK